MTPDNKVRRSFINALHETKRPCLTPPPTGIPEGTKDTKPRIPRPELLGALTALALMGVLAENHDDVMPTKGKGRVTKEEAMKLIEWIQDGAQFTKAPTKEKE